jgi:hypothetical protein
LCGSFCESCRMLYRDMGLTAGSGQELKLLTIMEPQRLFMEDW